MSKIKHVLKLELTWETPKDNEFAQYMTHSLMESIHGIQSTSCNTDMTHRSTHRIVTESGNDKSHIEIFFNLGKKYNFNNLIVALHKIDELVAKIPVSCNATAVMSTKNFCTPWTNKVLTGDYVGLLLRKGTFKKDVKIGESIRFWDNYEISRIVVLGEPGSANKVHRTIERYGQSKGYNLPGLIESLSTDTRYDNWLLILEHPHGQVSFINRRDNFLYPSTVRIIKDGFKTITQKYPERAFLKDIYTSTEF